MLHRNNHPRSWHRPWRHALAAALFAAAAVVAPARAAMPGGHNALAPDVRALNDGKAPILNDVSFDQHLDAQLPLDLHFKDDTGRDIKLGDVVGQNGRPTVLALVYFKCPSLCTMVLNDLLHSVRTYSLTAGKDFNIVAVSFDPHEGPDLAAQKKASYVKQYNRPEGAAGWHFLTGSEASIKSLTETVGFHYVYDPKFDQYAHASGITLVTPAGRISRYFFGIDYDPADLRLSLVEAGGGKIGGPVEQLLLYCYHYDPTVGKYSLAVTNVLKIAGGITVLVMGGGIAFFLRKERTGGHGGGGPQPALAGGGR